MHHLNPLALDTELTDEQARVDVKPREFMLLVLLLLNATANGISVTLEENAGTPADKSGTANGNAQTVAAANSARKYFMFQNPSGNAGTMWVNIRGVDPTAASPHIEVKPGQGFTMDSRSYVSLAAIKVIGSNGEKWTALEG